MIGGILSFIKYSLIGLIIFSFFGLIFIHMHKAFGKSPDEDRMKQSPQFEDGKFQNPVKTESADFSQVPGILKRMIKRDVEKAPVGNYHFSEKGSPGEGLWVNWLGHASLLLHYKDKYVLTDPMLSGRASPFSWMGPQRFFNSPVMPGDMPEIELLIISHDHYDHLDYRSIKQLSEKVKHFVVPLGVAASLRHWDIPGNKIIEMDWWEDTLVSGIRLTATPARHFSGRLFSRNNTLWNSYVLEMDSLNIYFAGDSGFFEKYKDIGDAKGPFDLSFIPIGAYDQAWADIHLNPEEAAHTWQLLNGGRMMPIHWGTFDLGLHPWYEPIDWLLREAGQQNIPLITPRPGEWIAPLSDTTDPHWWKAYSRQF